MIFLLLDVFLFISLSSIATARGDEMIDLKKQIAEMKNRIIHLETRQRNQEESVNRNIEEPNEDTSETAPIGLRAFWKEGLNFTTQDGNFKLKAGGRIHNDWLWISEDSDLKADVSKQEDGTEFRRARLYMSGLIYGNVEFKAQYDFADGDADFKDVYIGLLNLPLGNIRAGHFKEPFSLEEITSSNHITFLERALPNAFAPSRNTGVMLYGTALAASDPRMTWAAGVFRDTADDGDIQEDGGYNITGRLTWLPLYEGAGTSLVHLGVAYSHRNPNDETVSFSSTPEADLADSFIDTGSFRSDDVDLIGLETACVSGPLSVQGEYIFANADIASSANFHGYYVQASYFLTGEHRSYKSSEGVFSRVKPNENFKSGGGPGAWEVALRYSGLDLDDYNITGGELHEWTAGLNWYLNPNTRIMWNYVHADKDRVGNADMFMMRLQVHF